MNKMRDVTGGTAIQANKIDSVIIEGDRPLKVELLGGHLAPNGDWKGVPFGRASKGWEIAQGKFNPAFAIKVSNPTSRSIFVGQVTIDIAQDGDFESFTPHFLVDGEHPWFPLPVKREVPSQRSESWLVNLKLFGDMVRFIMGEPDWPIFHIRARVETEDGNSVSEKSWHRFPPK